MTDSEQCFDRLTRLAAKTLGASAARICLDDEHRRFIGSGALSRDSLCERAQAGSEPSLLTSPIVLRKTQIGLFVVDGSREWVETDRELLAQFARTAAAEIELEIALRDVDDRLPHAHSNRRRILVAEDDDAMRKLIAGELGADGYAVSEARNGREALDLARSEDFDLMVLDLVMPDLSGWDVLQHRATDPRLQAVPIVIVSARRGPDVARAVAFGVYGVLPKPLEPADLRDLVRTYFADGRVGAGSQPAQAG
ncbi:MAG TPA: response regulator [Thermoanaerobaculia bacterium]|jgi:CheY-like chemotaxis protein|nr:response regulator [Thermoanaerobaculia bacterium]